MFVKIVAVVCLAACVSGAAPRRSNQLVPAASQVAPQTALPANSVDPKQAQQAKLHYMEIGPSLKGDYKFGYDTGSGPAGQSFREETRLDDGTVKGAYGYIDANGKQRIVKYTAGKAGFVVDSDQEAGNGAAKENQAAPEAPAAPQPVHRPQAVSLPQPTAAPFRHQAPVERHQAPVERHQAPIERLPAPVAPAAAQPNAVNFDEPAPALTRQQAEAQHAQQLRQHQLAQQQALAQQQHLAQQQQFHQQQLLQQQQQQQQQQFQQQAAQQDQLANHQSPVTQPQFTAPQQPNQHHHHQQLQQQQPQHHQQLPQQQHQHQQHFPAQAQHQAQAGPAPVVHQFNQPGHFFAQSNDANLNQLLAMQMRHLQQHQAQLPRQQQHQQQQQFPAPTDTQFGVAPQFASHQPANRPAENPDFSGHQIRASRQANFAQEQPAHSGNLGANPQSALLALHQQQQQDAQVLASLRAQQLAMLEQQQRQRLAASQASPQPQQQPQHAQHHHHQLASQQAAAQATAQPQQPTFEHSNRLNPAAHHANLATGPISGTPAVTPAAQPEVFGPPVIDIRTLNYSIGQQTRVL